MIAVHGSDALDALADGLRERAVEIARKRAEEIAQRARGYAPVESGALRASIGTRVIEDGAVVYASAPYAAAVELGSFAQPPRPFLGRAAAEIGRRG